MKKIAFIAALCIASICVQAQQEDAAKLKTLLNNQKTYANADRDMYTFNDSLYMTVNACEASYSLHNTELLYEIDQLIVNHFKKYSFQWKDVKTVFSNYEKHTITLFFNEDAVKYAARPYGEKEWNTDVTSQFDLCFSNKADITTALNLLKNIITSCGGQPKMKDSYDRLKSAE